MTSAGFAEVESVNSPAERAFVGVVFLKRLTNKMSTTSATSLEDFWVVVQETELKGFWAVQLKHVYFHEMYLRPNANLSHIVVTKRLVFIGATSKSLNYKNLSCDLKPFGDWKVAKIIVGLKGTLIEAVRTFVDLISYLQTTKWNTEKKGSVPGGEEQEINHEPTAATEEKLSSMRYLSEAIEESQHYNCILKGENENDDVGKYSEAYDSDETHYEPSPSKDKKLEFLSD